MVPRWRARVLVIGVGGIGSPLALVLARAGVGTLGLVDDDRVERTNLHRQILFRDEDVGQSKLESAARGLARLAPGAKVELRETRFVPENALALVSGYDLVVEGADNFPTKFLAADAARIAERPIVHAAAVRTIGTVLSVAPRGAPCYRCLFEDLPREDAPNCDAAGVVGPLLGLVAAYQADLALAALDEGAGYGTLVRVDVSDLTPRVRSRTVPARHDCIGCGERAALATTLDPDRYVPPACRSEAS